MTVTLQEAQLDAIIRRVLEKMDVSRPPVSSAYRGVFATADQALEAVYRAQIAYRRVSIAKRKAIIDAIREVVIENAQRLAQMAVEETKMGRVSDKVLKHLLVADNCRQARRARSETGPSSRRPA